MATQPEPLKHDNAEKKDDTTLVSEAQGYLARTPALQIVAELLAELRAKHLTWWTPDGLRTRYGAQERMRWLAQRPDLRQQITTSLTGLVPKAARKKDPDFQAGLLDAAIDDGDIPVKAFEDAFEPRDLAVYGPAPDFWRQFRLRMPWGQDSVPHQEIVAFLLKMLLTDKGALGLSRKPILTPWELRTNISGKAWHTRMPIEVRIAIDDARFERERSKPKEPFHAKDDLALALPEIMASNLPLKEFLRVLDAAERAMGFEPTGEAQQGAEGASSPSFSPPAPMTTSAFPAAAVDRSSGPPMGPPRMPSQKPPPLRPSSSATISVTPPASPVTPSSPPSGAPGDGATAKGDDASVDEPPDAERPTANSIPAAAPQDDSDVLFDVDLAPDDPASGIDRLGDRPTRSL